MICDYLQYCKQNNSTRKSHDNILWIILILFALSLMTGMLSPCDANRIYAYGNDSWTVNKIHMNDPEGAWVKTAKGKQYFYNSSQQKIFYENQLLALNKVLSRKGLFAYNQYGQKVEFSRENAANILSDLLLRDSFLYLYNDTHDMVPLFSFTFSTEYLGEFLLTDINGNPLYFPTIASYKALLADSVRKVILYDKYGRKIYDNSGEEFAMYYGEGIGAGNGVDLLTFLSIESGTNKAYMLDPHKNKIYIYNRNGDQLYIEKNPYSNLFVGNTSVRLLTYDHDSLLIDSDINFLNVGDKVYFLTDAGAKIFVSPRYKHSSAPILYNQQSSPLYVVDFFESYYYDSRTGYFTYQDSNVPRYEYNRNGSLTIVTVRGINGWYDPNNWDLLYNQNGKYAKTKTLPNSGISPKLKAEHVKNASVTSNYSKTKISISKIGLDTDILGVPGDRGAWDVSWLGNYAGWLQNSDYPGSQGDSNSVITAHSYLYDGLPGPFANIDQLGYGDQIHLQVFGDDYVYTVIDNKTTFEDDLSVLNKCGFPCLTLITCKGYDEVSDSYKYRVVIRARLTEIN